MFVVAAVREQSAKTDIFFKVAEKSWNCTSMQGNSKFYL